jgi:polyribonucleotide nucleotidyltransferase
MKTKKEMTLDFYGKKLTLSTGTYAKQSSGSAWVSLDETVVLATACRSSSPREGADFLPLTVEYQEKFYASGRIPGGFFKREGRPSETATLVCRLIDRPIRPLFAKGYAYDTQVVATVLSLDPNAEADVLSLTAASTALMLSDMPFAGPIGGVRVVRMNDEFKINPNPADVPEKPEVDLLVVSGSKGIVMVEGAAQEATEDVVAEALFTADKANQELIAFQNKFIASCDVSEKLVITEPEAISWPAAATSLMETGVKNILSITDKIERVTAEKTAKDALFADLKNNDAYAPLKEKHSADELKFRLKNEFHGVLKTAMRQQILKSKSRIDKRGLTDVRPIWCEKAPLPRAHGSAIFTRGETQVLGVVTLGSGDDAQRMDTMTGQSEKTFMLHYNFPPYSVGEAGFMRGPGRREIGHGALAERALKAMLPSPEEFGFTIRLVSEVLESNGSSSMGTVCAGAMAMLVAGVPLKASVAGIAMGLICEGKDTAILTDILGDEDHLGDMDFKVAGTEKGITAIQMDIKIDGLSQQVMKDALAQAREGRLHILKEMAKTIDKPSEDMSPYAPKIWKHKINPRRIKDLIGSQGKNIKGIVAETGVKIDVDDNGNVSIATADNAAAEKALAMVKDLTTDVEVGQTFEGKVRKITEYGAFVDIGPNTSGLVHISELAEGRVTKVEDVCQEGETLQVKVIEIDRSGRIRLSHKATFESQASH